VNIQKGNTCCGYGPLWKDEKREVGKAGTPQQYPRHASKDGEIKMSCGGRGKQIACPSEIGEILISKKGIQ